MPAKIATQPLTKSAFAAYGEVIEITGSHNYPINNGKCIRHHALALVDVTGEGANVGVSIFSGSPYALPHRLTMVERHPLGSQAFYPLGTQPWLVIVCDDDNGTPANPKAFLATASQGINLQRNIWHGVLTPLCKPSDFLVVDRIGEGNNLEEYHFDQPALVDLS